jgi:5-methylthioadenosine/S-adenosylhomocysteine deaminase
MKDDSSSRKFLSLGKRGISRRRVLEMTAFGLAGTLLPSAPLVGPAFANEDHERDRRRRVLLKGGFVLTLDDRLGDFARGDVLIEGEKIRDIGQQLHVGDAEVIDCSGMIVMPGLIDTHRHMWQGLLRNIGPDDVLDDYVKKILFGAALKMTPQDVYLGDTISALSALSSGITTILDWSHIANTPAHTEAAIHALQDAKIRAVYGYGPSFGLSPPWYDPASPGLYPQYIRTLRPKFFNTTDQLLTLALAAAGPEFSLLGVDSSLIEWKIAREVGARISVHVGVGKQADARGVQRMGQMGLLKNDTTYIHCCTLNETEMRMIADTGGTVSLAVPIEMQMGHGTPPIQQFLNLGVRPSLSVDVETNQPSDMFTQMHAAFALQRVLYNESHRDDCFFEFTFVSPVACKTNLLNTRDVLKFATIEGARANALLHKTGTLTPGKQADVILLRAKQINVAPINDVVGSIVLGMDRSNVDSVFIAGNAVKRNGRLVGVDVDRLVRKADFAREALLAR